ncbi:hypothetical protein P4O66_018393, partial [Electrophorus voltai]
QFNCTFESIYYIKLSSWFNVLLTFSLVQNCSVDVTQNSLSEILPTGDTVPVLAPGAIREQLCEEVQWGTYSSCEKARWGAHSGCEEVQWGAHSGCEEVGRWKLINLGAAVVPRTGAPPPRSPTSESGLGCPPLPCFPALSGERWLTAPRTETPLSPDACVCPPQNRKGALRAVGGSGITTPLFYTQRNREVGLGLGGSLNVCVVMQSWKCGEEKMSCSLGSGRVARIQAHGKKLALDAHQNGTPLAQRQDEERRRGPCQRSTRGTSGHSLSNKPNARARARTRTQTHVHRRTHIDEITEHMFMHRVAALPTVAISIAHRQTPSPLPLRSTGGLGTGARASPVSAHHRRRPAEGACGQKNKQTGQGGKRVWDSRERASRSLLPDTACCAGAIAFPPVPISAFRVISLCSRSRAFFVRTRVRLRRGAQWEGVPPPQGLGTQARRFLCPGWDWSPRAARGARGPRGPRGSNRGGKGGKGSQWASAPASYVGAAQSAGKGHAWESDRPDSRVRVFTCGGAECRGMVESEGAPRVELTLGVCGWGPSEMERNALVLAFPTGSAENRTINMHFEFLLILLVIKAEGAAKNGGGEDKDANGGASVTEGSAGSRKEEEEEARQPAGAEVEVPRHGHAPCGEAALTSTSSHLLSEQREDPSPSRRFRALSEKGGERQEAACQLRCALIITCCVCTGAVRCVCRQAPPNKGVRIARRSGHATVPSGTFGGDAVGEAGGAWGAEITEQSEPGAKPLHRGREAERDGHTNEPTRGGAEGPAR